VVLLICRKVQTGSELKQVTYSGSTWFEPCSERGCTQELQLCISGLGLQRLMLKAFSFCEGRSSQRCLHVTYKLSSPRPSLHLVTMPLDCNRSLGFSTANLITSQHTEVCFSLLLINYLTVSHTFHYETVHISTS
jgi:hypothetical protein